MTIYVHEDKASGYGGPEIAETKQGVRDRHKEALKADIAAQKAEHRERRKGLAKDHRAQWEDLKDTHESERYDHREEWDDKHRGVKADIAAEKSALIDEMRADIRVHFPRHKAELHPERSGGNPDHRQGGERADLIEQHGFQNKWKARPLRDRGDDLGGDLHPGDLATPSHRDGTIQDQGRIRLVQGGTDGQTRRLGAGRTHKASSAESILRHVLRLLGWTAAYKQGKLTERRRIKLLDAIRQYGREWLRHEAEQLFGVHGTERSLGSAAKHAVGRFFDRARGFVRELIVAGSMALNGPAPLDDHDLAEADRAAVVQSMYLERFAAEVELNTPPELAVPTAPPAPNALSAPQILDRAEKYAGSVWGDAINARRQKIIRSGRYSQERRVHARPMGRHDACATCLGESDKGWVPIGRLLPIGDSECLGIRCDCYFEYRNAA